MMTVFRILVTIRLFNKALALLLFVAISAATTQQSIADKSSEAHDGILVEGAVVRPAKIGESTKLHFKITNDTSSDVMLVGLRSNSSRHGRMMINLPTGGKEEVSQLLILREETLDFASSHISVELNELLTDIEPGALVSFVLIFRGFTVEADAHAH